MLIPIDTHIYEDKFYCEVVTCNVDHVKDVVVYGRSIPENLKDAAIGESDSLLLIRLCSIMVTQRSVVT